MAFFTRPHFEDRQFVQYNDESITLSGTTYLSTDAQINIQPSYLNNKSDDGNGVFSGLTSGSTTISGLNGELISRVSGLVVQPPILNLLDLSGNTTGTTTVDVTGYVLKSFDSGGTAVWGTVASLSADTNTFLTGSSINCTTNVLTLGMNNGSIYNTDLTCVLSGRSNYNITTNFVANTPKTITHNLGIGDELSITLVDTVTNEILGGFLDNFQTNSFDTTFSQNYSGVKVVVIAGGSGNITNNNTFLSFSGGSGNCITDLYVTNIHGCSPITIHDSIQSNTSSVSGTTNSLALGYSNTVKSDKSSILGGENNYIQGFGGPIGRWSVIGGGRGNYSYSIGNTITGGFDNYSLSYYGFIGGGYGNYIDGRSSAIVAGDGNKQYTNTDHCFIGGGVGNIMDNGTDGSVIGGGHRNKINKSYRSSILGGKYNIISGNFNSDYNTIIGGINNYITGSTNTHIIGSNITATTSNTTYLNKLKFSDSGSTFISDINSNLDIGVMNDPINGDLFKIYFGTSYFGIRNTGSTNSVESVFLGNDSLGDILQVTTDGIILEQEITSKILDLGTISGGINVNIRDGNVQKFTLSGNTVLNGISASTINGGDLTVHIYQDGSGGHTLTKGINILTESGSPISVTTGATTTDTLFFKTDSEGKYRLQSHTKDFN
jgi:hypothetical protein